MTIAQSVLLACLGFGVGTLGASVGVGGGFLIVPALLALFPDASPATITSMSLTAVVMNGISASIGYRRLRWQDTRTGLVLISTAVPMAALGALATRGINRGSFDLIFGVALVIASLYLAIKGSSVPSVPKPSSSGRARTIADARGNVFQYRVREPLAAAIASIAGFVAAFFGIGGGIINVPVMMLVLKMPSPMAVATSQMELVAAAAIAVLIHLMMNSAEADAWIRAGILGAGTLFGAQAGVWLGPKVSARFVLTVISAGLLIAGLKEISSAIL